MSWRVALLILVGAGVIIAVAMADPVAQDPLYHLFADQRALANIPNFLNVMSNLPFLVVGILGWIVIMRSPEVILPGTKPSWMIFFTGVALTAFGSGYFHLNPNNDTLVWDRLPMTVSFMSLVSIIIAEYFSPALGRKTLPALLLAGIASVVYWAFTESLGHGDLRPYALVQFLPMLLIPLIILLYPTRSDLGRYVWWMIGFYVAAKVFEQLDGAIYVGGHMLSGHTLKHLAASLAPLSLVYGLLQRRKHGFPR
ncbi:MAG: ceramidase [Gammaproteobacteria bacterium]|nr:ceramidase [Gammaproteobacteria bacterium]MDH5584769.1 ceramidase [Gammaproteobacteria bacterium]